VETINAGDTAWVMMSAALVLFMTPGLAIFYAGMVRVKSVLNMIMMSFAAMGVVSIVWVMYGYSLTFGPDSGAGVIGDLSLVGLSDVPGTTVGAPGHEIPTLAFVMFQMTFAIITVALLSGAIADRAKFRAWMVFMIIWVTLVYFPIAHWAFMFDGGDGGWIGDRLGALDFAGGTAVEITSGASALALAIVLGPRMGWRREAMRPHNLPLVLLGAGMLWFGWFGFNAGSALTAGSTAAVALINTQVCTAAAALSWIAVERLRDGHATTLGAASGAIVGAVAITPSCAFLTPMGAIGLGLVAGAISAVAVGWKYRLGYDDSLDVVGVHGMGGVVGMLAIGLLATTSVNPAGQDGLLAGGGLALLGKQTVAVIATAAFAFTMTLLLAHLVNRVVGFRADADDELRGLDVATHAESAYEFGPTSGVGVLSGTHPGSMHREIE
jgi:ammonium transporter, Amt family